MFLLLANVPLFGQIDTLLLPEIEKKVKAIEKDAGTYIFSFDSLDHKLAFSKSLADIFSESSIFNINTNGPGNLSTMSFRGLRTVHTALEWNGININSRSSGLSDLSLLNANLFDDISIQSDEHPGSSISLNNSEYINDKAIEVNFGMKSFSGRNYGLTYETGDGKFYSRTHFDHLKRENDFPYRNGQNVGAVIENRVNSFNKGWNFQQDLGIRNTFRSKTSEYSGHIWYSKFDRQIPSNILWLPDEANQQDRSFKLAFKTRMEDGIFTWSNVIGYVNDKLEYANPTYEFSSNYRESRANLCSEFKFDLDPLMLNGGLKLRTMSIESSNYTLIRPETGIEFWGKAQKRWIDSRLVLGLKQEFSNIYKVPFNVSLGYDQYYAKSKVWGSVKRVGRAPNYDDLFFKPGGNPELDPEFGWALEAGWAWHPLREQKDRYTINVYRSEMKNWIQWVPDSSFNYSPENYKSVTINGFLIAYKQVHKGIGTDVLTDLKIGYNKAINNEVVSDEDLQEKDLIYSPAWNFNTKIAFIEGQTFFGYRGNFTNKRFADELNQTELPSYYLHDIFVSTQISKRFILNLEVKNITNKSYESIANYPMYGINFGFDLIYQSFSSEEKEAKSKKPRSVKAKSKKAKYKRRRGGRRW